MSKQDQPTVEAVGTPQKKSKKLILIMAIVLLGGAGGGGYFMMKPASADAEAVVEEAKPEAGKVIPLESVTVNLADGHYLKMKFALQATLEAGEEELDGSRAVDLAITQYTDLKLGELSTAAGREKVKLELLEKVTEAYEGKIMDIYFTEFVMQ